MQLLALESSTDRTACALWRDGQIVERLCAADAPSSATLLPAVGTLLAEAGIALGAVDGIAFGAGPGSFTGLRIACGVAQGLAFAADLPVVPVSTLAAMAEASGEEYVMAVLDARMHEVYFGQFRRLAGRLVAVGDAGVAAPAMVPAPAAGCMVCGNALATYPQLFEHMAETVRRRPEIMPTAAAVAALGARQLADGAGIAADAAVPLYVRDKVAFTVAERLAAGGRA